MSHYEELRDAAARDRYSPPDDLHYALWSAADDIQRLWRAVEPYTDAYQVNYCPACEEYGHHAPDCPREALRPLFGEEAE